MDDNDEWGSKRSAASYERAGSGLLGSLGVLRSKTGKLALLVAVLIVLGVVVSVVRVEGALAIVAFVGAVAVVAAIVYVASRDAADDEARRLGVSRAGIYGAVLLLAAIWIGVRLLTIALG